MRLQCRYINTMKVCDYPLSLSIYLYLLGNETKLAEKGSSFALSFGKCRPKRECKKERNEANDMNGWK